MQALVRNIKKSWQYYLTIVLSLSVTLAALFSVFSVVDTVYLKPLPYQDEQELFLAEGNLKYNGAITPATNTQNMLYVQEKASSIQDFGMYFSWSSYQLVDADKRTAVPVLLASNNLFDVLQVEPVKGRFFNGSEALGNKQPSVIISYRAWQNQFNKDPDIIGKNIQLNSRRFQIIGVTPDDWVLPGKNDVVESYWLPLDMDEQLDPKTFAGYGGSIKAVARLAPNTSLQQAEDELQTLMAEAAAIHTPQVANAYPVSAAIMPITDAIRKDSDMIVIFLSSAALLMAFIALTNLCSLQLGRATLREQTLAISYAFGATNKQLFAHVLQHNLSVVGFSAIIGVTLTAMSFNLIYLLGSEALPRLESLDVGFGMLTVAVLLTLTIALLFTWVEMRNVSEKTLSSHLQRSGKGTSKQLSRAMSYGLIGAQVTLSVVTLLVSSQVLTNNLNEALRSNHLNTDNTWSVTVKYSEIASPQERISLQRALSDQISNLSDVISVSRSSESIVPKDLNLGPVTDEGMNIVDSAKHSFVDEHMFASLGIAIEGRAFEASDKDLEFKPVIINQRLANKMGGNPIGKKLRVQGSDKALPIVGIASNISFPGASDREVSEVYVAMSYLGWEQDTFFIKTTATDLQHLSATMRSLDSRLELVVAEKLDEQFYTLAQKIRFSAWISGSVAAVTLLMVLAGITGIVTYMLSNRRYDLGVRMAFGASNQFLLKEELMSLAKPIFISMLFALSIVFFLSNLAQTFPALNVEIEWALMLQVVIGILMVLAIVTILPVKNTLSHDPIKALRND